MTHADEEGNTTSDGYRDISYVDWAVILSVAVWFLFVLLLTGIAAWWSAQGFPWSSDGLD